jgi:phosphoglycolate phosphatase
MKIKACLFDLDGTLLDTAEDITHAINQVLKDLNLKSVSSDICMQYVGNGLKNTLKGVLNYSSYSYDEKEADRLFLSLINYYKKEPYQRSSIYAGIEQLLDDLVTNKIKLGVLSNKDHTLTKVIVEYYFNNYDFVLIQGATEAKLLKPNPYWALQFASLANCDVNEVLLVGDSEVDYNTAVNANMQKAIGSWGFREASALKRSIDEKLYANVEELHKEVLLWL